MIPYAEGSPCIGRSERPPGGKKKHVEFASFNRGSCARPRGPSVSDSVAPVPFRDRALEPTGLLSSLIGNSRGVRRNLLFHWQHHRHRQGADCVAAPLTTGPGCTVAALSGELDPLPRSDQTTAISPADTPLSVWGLLWGICTNEPYSAQTGFGPNPATYLEH